jgi:hypothetical protein
MPQIVPNKQRYATGVWLYAVLVKVLKSKTDKKEKKFIKSYK